MKVAVLIAEGDNELMIPCRIFENIVKGRVACDKIFGEPKNIRDSGTIVYERYLEAKQYDPEGVISKTLFTSHYYGNGGPYRFLLSVIPFNKAFIGWDLD